MLYNYRRLSYEDKRRKTAFHSRVPLSDGRFAESGVKAQGFKDVAEAAIETDLKYEGIATISAICLVVSVPSKGMFFQSYCSGFVLIGVNPSGRSLAPLLLLVLIAYLLRAG